MYLNSCSMDLGHDTITLSLFNILSKDHSRSLLAIRSYLSLIAMRYPSLRFPNGLLFSFLVLGIMADNVMNILENMRLTMEEEKVIDIPDEGRKEGLESCALSLIRKFLTCRPLNKKAAVSTLKRA